MSTAAGAARPMIRMTTHDAPIEYKPLLLHCTAQARPPDTTGVASPASSTIQGQRRSHQAPPSARSERPAALSSSGSKPSPDDLLHVWRWRGGAPLWQRHASGSGASHACRHMRACLGNPHPSSYAQQPPWLLRHSVSDLPRPLPLPAPPARFPALPADNQVCQDDEPHHTLAERVEHLGQNMGQPGVHGWSGQHGMAPAQHGMTCLFHHVACHACGRGT